MNPRQLCDKIDKNTVACLVLQSGCRWLGVTLDYTGAVMVFASVVINLAMGHWNSDGRTSAASIGLSLNYRVVQLNFTHEIEVLYSNHSILKKSLSSSIITFGAPGECILSRVFPLLI